MQEVNLGQYALPVILTVILSVIYKVFGENETHKNLISNRAKPLIAIGIGMFLGLLSFFYKGLDFTFKNLIDHLLYGFMTGCSAVGIWEGFRASVPGK
ncbi:MAG: hypothetical protein K6T87_15935 [Roseiflexus sp.]|uniref:hypothetical protein n=1 Tax=Roseiflexus sp. TaxID=2562120 RepID=UPI0025CD1A79|nr:hypothetical protein [Roseiflexus sp.]MCL6542046.1 hypothetical protein [Roseiflexus sp.]